MLCVQLKSTKYRLNKLNNRRMNSNKISRLQNRHHDFLLNENLKHFSIAANLCVQYLCEHFYFANRNMYSLFNLKCVLIWWNLKTFLFKFVIKMRWVARVTAHHHGSKINHNYISSNLSHQINSKFEIIVTDFICPRRLKTFFCLDLKTCNFWIPFAYMNSVIEMYTN